MKNNYLFLLYMWNVNSMGRIKTCISYAYIMMNSTKELVQQISLELGYRDLHINMEEILNRNVRNPPVIITDKDAYVFIFVTLMIIGTITLCFMYSYPIINELNLQHKWQKDKLQFFTKKLLTFRSLNLRLFDQINTDQSAMLIQQLYRKTSIPPSLQDLKIKRETINIDIKDVENAFLETNNISLEIDDCYNNINNLEKQYARFISGEMEYDFSAIKVSYEKYQLWIKELLKEYNLILSKLNIQLGRIDLDIEHQNSKEVLRLRDKQP